jgi:shikimate kinase
VSLPRALAVLVGPMASGKSKIGRRVANELRVDVIDTDKTIVAEFGAIADIFAEQGEKAFRAIEREHVARALSEPAIVSLGGGAVLDADTQHDLERLPVVYLTVTPEAVAWRINNDKRPLLAENGLQRWKEIFAERRPIYERLASITIDTSSGRLDDMAANIAQWIRAGYPREWATLNV